MIKPRQDYLDWDTTFMALAKVIALRSKDPNTYVGTVIADRDNRILGMGYNGFPRQISNNAFSWAREGDFLDKKYPYVIHSEINAIFNSNRSNLAGSKLFCTHASCNECAKMIIQSQISEVVYLLDPYHDQPEYEAARALFDMADIKLRQYRSAKAKIEIDLTIGK